MLLWTMLFATFSVVFGGVILIWWRMEEKRRRRNLLTAISGGENLSAPAQLPAVLVEPAANQGLLARWFRAGNSPADAGEKSKWSAGGFLVLTVGMAFAGFLLGTKLMSTFGTAAPLFGAAGFGAMPWRQRARKRKKRLSMIEEQFPEALDFVARCVRAGNALSVALELLGTEAVDPLQSEILRLNREMALGASLEDGLNGLADRIPLVEVRFFVSAVLLQRETGGNLSEVLGKLAVSVRERLRLRGQVRASSGQARLTAIVLTVLPVATVVMMKVISPTYIDSMTNDPVGRELLGAGALSQFVGYLVMRKIVNFEV